VFLTVIVVASWVISSSTTSRGSVTPDSFRERMAASPREVLRPAKDAGGGWDAESDCLDY
jgi:hypothetical protein